MYFDGINISIDEHVNENYNIYAHKNGEGYETLNEHISLCEKYFLMIIKEKGLEKIFLNIENEFLKEASLDTRKFFRELLLNTIMMHDMGKVNPWFQEKQLGNNIGIKEVAKFNNSKHSLISSILYLNFFIPRIKECPKEERDIVRDFMMINAYIISRHHSSLKSFDDFEELFEECVGDGWRLLTEQKILYEETYKYPIKISLKTINGNFKKLDPYRKGLSKEKKISRYIYARLLMSILFACDFYSTSEYINGIAIKDIGSINDIDEFYDVYKQGKIYNLIREYESKQYAKTKDLSKVKDINILRNEMFLDAENALSENINSNIFYLEAPTGSGKSNVATNLSFKLLEEDKSKNKIFYVYPFNTLVEQNIETLRRVFEKEPDVFNKISVINSVTPMDKNDEKEEVTNFDYYKKILLNRQFLNYPMVLTTHVTMFKYLFSTSKEDTFPLHQLANSVIVLDEIQSYKNMIWREIISFLHGYAKILNIKFIIMSATLPNFDEMLDDTTGTKRLIYDRDKYFKNPIFKDRVKVDFSLMQCENVEEELFKYIKERSNEKRKILVEFISKKSAYEFYEKLNDDEEIKSTIELMTGDDNIDERKRIINKIKDSKDLILVATQVIEAGVNIDMDIGYKDSSLLDNDEQFLGRINRSCLKKGCIVYFFDLDETTQIYKNDIRNNKEFTLKNELMRNILENKEFKDYYKKVINQLKIVTEKENDDNTSMFFDSKVGSLDFDGVREKMKLIDENKDMYVYLNHDIKMDDGKIISGSVVWEKYKKLLQDNDMDYAEKRVKLSKVKADMNKFIYRVKEKYINYNDVIGNISFINDGEKYFESGKLNRKKFVREVSDFI